MMTSKQANGFHDFLIARFPYFVQVMQEIIPVMAKKTI